MLIIAIFAFVLAYFNSKYYVPLNNTAMALSVELHKTLNFGNYNYSPAQKQFVKQESLVLRQGLSAYNVNAANSNKKADWGLGVLDPSIGLGLQQNPPNVPANVSLSQDLAGLDIANKCPLLIYNNFGNTLGDDAIYAYNQSNPQYTLVRLYTNTQNGVAYYGIIVPTS